MGDFIRCQDCQFFIPNPEHKFKCQNFGPGTIRACTPIKKPVVRNIPQHFVSRFESQCKTCACWCENILKSGDPEVIEVIKTHDLECTQEQEIWTAKVPCLGYSPKEE